jgi:hypothetical protein
VRDLHDDLFLVLFYDRGLVIGFVVGEEYGRNGSFSQILSRHGQGVIHFPDDGSTPVTRGEPCAKSNGPRIVSRTAAARSANVVWLYLLRWRPFRFNGPRKEKSQQRPE